MTRIDGPSPRIPVAVETEVSAPATPPATQPAAPSDSVDTRKGTTSKETVLPTQTSSESVGMLLAQLATLLPAGPPATQPAEAFAPNAFLLVPQPLPPLNPSMSSEDAGAAVEALSVSEAIAGYATDSLGADAKTALEALSQQVILPSPGMVKLESGVDIQQLVQLVMFRVSRDAQEDVRAILKQVQKANEQKQAIGKWTANARKEKARLEAQQRRLYDERRALPEEDIRWIPESITFEQFQQSQALIIDPNASPDSGDLHGEVSPNETRYPKETTDSKAMTDLAAQLKISVTSMQDLVTLWNSLPDLEKDKFGSMYAWLVSQDGAGLSATPSHSQEDSVAHTLERYENPPAEDGGDADIDPNALTIEQLQDLYGIGAGDALALNDYWHALPKSEREKYASAQDFVEHVLQSAPGTAHDAIGYFFLQVQSDSLENTFTEWDVDVETKHFGSEPQPPGLNNPEWIEYMNNRTEAHKEDAEGADMSGMDDLVKAFLAAELSFQHYATEKGEDGQSYDDYKNARDKALNQLLNGLKDLPPDQIKRGYEYTVARISECLCELRGAQLGNGSLGAGQDILGFAAEVGDGGTTASDHRFLSEYLAGTDPFPESGEVFIDRNAIGSAMDDLFGMLGDEFAPSSVEKGVIYGADVANAYCNGDEKYKNPVTPPTGGNNEMAGPGQSQNQIDKDAALLEGIYNAGVEVDNATLPHTEGLSEMSSAELGAMLDGWDEKKESIADFTSELQMKLQLAMDRWQKSQEMMSNIMAKIAETSKAIIGNMKS